jgi:outer membrane lipoprotein-sorting protein
MDPHSPEFEELIRKQLERLPMGQEITPELIEKLHEETRKRQVQGPRRRLVAVGLTCVAVVAIAMAYMGGAKKAEAKSWVLIKQAVEKVKTIQMTITSSKDGGDKQLSIAFSSDGLAMDTGKGEKMYVGKEGLLVYSPEKKTAFRMKFDAGDTMDEVADDITGEFNLKKMIKEYEDQYGKGSVQISPVQTVNGHQIYYATFASAKDNSKAVLTVDATSDLPVHIDADTNQDGKVEHDVIDLKYNEDVDKSLFNTNLPDDVKVNEMDLGKMKEWGESIGKSFEGFGGK